MNSNSDNMEEMADGVPAAGEVAVGGNDSFKVSNDSMPQDALNNDGTHNPADENAESKEQKTNRKVLGIPLPDGLNRRLDNFSASWQKTRQSILIAAPAFVLNHSSNVIGAMQLTAEMMFQKSSGIDLVPKEKRNNPLNYIIEPPKNILTNSFSRSQSNTKLSDLLKPSYLKEEFKNFNNLERASQIDSQGGKVKLVNRWSVRSGLVVFVTMSCAAFLPDVKDTAEETQENAEMSRVNPLRYFATRVGQALWFPAETVIDVGKKIANPDTDQRIGEHKRQFAGLGYMFSGAFSVISGFRQIEGKFPAQTQMYRRNYAQMLGGAISSVAGYLLLTGVDNQQGWSNWGQAQMARLLTLPNSILGRFKPGPTGKYEQGAEWYLGASMVLQVKNFVAAFIGGAEKKDGKVIDHKEIREKALLNAEKLKRARKARGGHIGEDSSMANDAATALPSTLVKKIQQREVAMPERVEAKQQEMAEATV